MKLYIDDKELEIDTATPVYISLEIASISEPDSARAGYSKTIEFPNNPHNRAIMGHCEEINSVYMFNHEDHTAKIEQNGSIIWEGVPYLIEASDEYYRVSIIGAAKKWANYAARTAFTNLGIEFNETINASMVEKSWTWDKPIRFLPVQRDGFNVENISNNIFPPIRILTFEDYHPFLSVKKILYKIFKNAGYELCSEFMESEYFNTLYISGNYPRKNVDVIKSRMDFKAGRFETVSSTADSYGRVYADPYRYGNSIGNIVDTADPNEEYEGIKLNDVFTNNYCFRKTDERIAFTPLSEVTVGFEYKFIYTTDYNILSRNELSGFNQINLEDGQTRTFRIPNRNVDRRPEFVKSKNFLLIVFDHIEGNTYRFMYDEVFDNGSTNTKGLASFTSKTSSITVSSDHKVGNPQLFILKPGTTSTYTTFQGDWALYDGYIEENGEVEVEVTLRSAPERILPSQPKFFDLIHFAGAQKGMKIKLHQGTTIKPVFTEYPNEGSVIKYEQCAAHEINCLTFINSIKHLFNLRFYTDEQNKKVFIEPFDIFYRNDTVVDWTDKKDCHQPIVVKEPGSEMAQTLIYNFISGDGAVSRQNHERQQTLGQWECAIKNKFASSIPRTYTNPVYTATISENDIFGDAPSALLIQAGDRDNADGERAENLNFAPKIIHYLGMAKLPAGEKWGWPTNDCYYPLCAFTKTGDNYIEPLNYREWTNVVPLQTGVNLCFEDRDGMDGLHIFRDKWLRFFNEGKRIEAALFLTPKDIEPLIKPNKQHQDFRALYKLDFNGEVSLYRLEQIKDYNPSGSGITKCVFIKEI